MDDALERLVTGLGEVRELLAGESLEPDVQRSDWGAQRDDIDALLAAFDREVLAVVDAAAAELAEAERPAMVGTVQTDGAEVAAVLHAAGRASDAMALLTRLRRLTPAEPAADLRAAEVDVDAYTRIAHATWVLTSGDRKRADGMAKAVLANNPAPEIAARARAILDAPRAITSAPSLGRLNGFGVGMYGARDHRGDTHVSTHCISALWVPIMPLSAYRVTDHGGSYTFYSKEKLSGFAIWARRAIAIGVVLLIAGLWANSYFNSANRRAQRAMSRAASAAKTGDIDTAIARYEAVLADYATKADRDVLGGASAALADLYTADAPDPFGITDVAYGIRVLRRFEAIAVRARNSEATAAMIEHVDLWADQLGTDSSEAILAASSLLEAAIPIATDAHIGAVAARRKALTVELAQAIAGTWPIVALELYMDLGDSADIEASADIVDKLAQHPALLRASSSQITAWIARGSRTSSVDGVRDRARDALASASAAINAADRTEVLTARDEAALTAWLARDPSDQEVAVALAGVMMGSNRAAEARTLLETLGLVGWLIPDAQQLLAQAYAETGMLEDADGVLSDILRYRLPRFVAASHAYDVAAREKQDKLINRAQLGQLPPALDAKLRTASDDEARAMFDEWLREQLENDASLAQLRDTYLSHSEVVPMSVSLGSVKLRRALAATGDTRTQLLTEAEQAYLAIRQDAEGMPAFHLGLGQVYFRLGKKDEAEAEFAAVLAQNDPELNLAAAAAYRDLGNLARSREVAERVYEAGDKPYDSSAAVLLGLTARDNDEAELWLSRADQSMPFVKTSLSELRARRLFEDGDLDGAARMMTQAAKEHEANAASSSAAANNAAVAYSFVYACTGELASLHRARANFDTAIRLEPDSALVVGNAADIHFAIGVLEVLGTWIDVKRLRTESGAVSIIGQLLTGSMRAEVVAALVKNASIAKAMALTEQEMALGPNSSRGFDRALRWYSWTRDVDKLRHLRDQLDARKVDIDASDAIASRDEYASGESDAVHIAALDGPAKRLRASLAGAGSGASKRTVAAAQALLGEAMTRRASITLDAVDARAAISALRAARTAWPAIDNGRSLAAALAQLAALETPGAAEVLAGARLYSAGTALYRRSLEPGADAMLSALRAHASFVEAVALRKQVTAESPTIQDWLIGSLAGDDALVASGQAYFTDQIEQLELEIELALDPSMPYYVYVHELSSLHGK